jgi:hypothetical protein
MDEMHERPVAGGCCGGMMKFWEDMYYYWSARNFFATTEVYLRDLYKIDPSHRDSKGRTPLHYLCVDGHLLVLQLLLVDHAIFTDLNAKDKDGRTPLHFACRNGHEKIAVALIKLGADISIKDATGWTALDAARFNGRKELLDALRGNVHPGLMSPKRVHSTPLSPSQIIEAKDLKNDIPPEETVFGVQKDDVFIPSPALQRLRKAGTTVQSRSSMHASNFAGVVNTAQIQAQSLENKGLGARQDVNADTKKANLNKFMKAAEAGM